jgi:hypothetical protein
MIIVERQVEEILSGNSMAHLPIICSVNRLLIIAVILILARGLALTLWTVRREDNFLRDDLLAKTSSLERGISPGQVNALSRYCI